MEVGCATAAGMSRSRAASTVTRFSSKNGGSFIAGGNWRAAGRQSASRFGLPLGIERLCGKLAIGLLEEDFHASLRLFELFLTFTGECNALFKQLHCVVQRKLRTFQAADDLVNVGESEGEGGFFLGFGSIDSRRVL